ncbi:MAG: alpha/beta hydrolase [Anaerolineae bacterium]|nr:lysophospholipase [Anaerolineae bacterium]MDW8068504.1 alpha/beta hydrolase [Anaerolineae bacterium]
MRHSEGTFAGFGGLPLYYQSWRPEGEPRAIVILVHGFGEHSGRYMNVVSHLVPRGHAIYALDHRGHGRSPGPRGYIHDWEEFREDIRAFVRMVAEQEPGRPLFLMGHSMGGLIVLEYALRYPEGLSGVIASGPVLAQVGLSPVLMVLARVLSRLWPRFAMNTGLDATSISRDPEVVATYRADPLVHSTGTARLGTEMTRAIRWTHEHAREWRLPLLILHGGADRLVPPEGSRRFFEHVPIADKERIEYEGGYHEPHNDTHRAQVLADLERWLERHL